MIYFLVILELAIALLAMDYQKPPWLKTTLIFCLVIVAIISIIIVVNDNKKSKKMEEKLSQIVLYSKETNEIVKTYVKKSKKTYPEDKTEAKIMIGLKKILDIIESYNITSVTDEGLGKITITFDKDFPNQLYEVSITGNRERIDYKITRKTTTSLSIEFSEESLDWIQIICWER